MQAIMKKKFKYLRNQKGLTLIELLAVIVILGVIAAIGVPAIGATISKSQADADIQSKLMLQDAAVRWAYAKNPSGSDTGTPDSDAVGGAIVSTSTLVTDGYLKSDVKKQVGGGDFTIKLIYSSTQGWTATAT